MGMIQNISTGKLIRNSYVLLILIGTVIVLTAFSDGKFITEANIVNILRVSASPLLIAVPATLLMITGNIDLSVGGMCGLIATVFAILAKNGVPLLVAMPIVIILGCGCGWFNGLLVTKLNITPVIATLATMSLYLGAAKLFLPERTDMIKGNMPPEMMEFAKSKALLVLSPSMIVAIIVVVVFVIIQRRSTLGKYSIAIGGNQTAAQLAGINTKMIPWLLYILTGAATGFAGITRASYMNAGDPDVGAGIEVQVIIAILLGGASFAGGSGSVLKTMAAIYIMICLDKGLTLMKVDSYWAMLVNGIVFIAALVINNAIILNEANRKKKRGISDSLKRVQQLATE
jgi:ribose transport system permease protein